MCNKTISNHCIALSFLYCYIFTGEEAIYDNAMRGSCETCKYLFLIGTGIGAIFGITFSAVAICVVAGVIRIMILISGLAAGKH